MSDKKEISTTDFDNMPPEEMMKWMDSLTGRDLSKSRYERLNHEINFLEQPTDYAPKGWTQAEYRAALEPRIARLRAELEKLKAAKSDDKNTS